MLADGVEISWRYLGDGKPVSLSYVIYAFDSFELDSGKFELRRGGERVPCEPQVLRLLFLLVANADRFVPRDEIIDVVWNGRIISEAALSSRIKSARRALGDDGASQRLIRTVHGQGFRFVGTPVHVSAAPEARSGGSSPDAPASNRRSEPRPSIAILPFEIPGPVGDNACWAHALPHDLIVELSRLHWLFVIARGSSFQFSSATADVREVGTRLGVRYCLTGSIKERSGGVDLTVELSDTRDAEIVWSERYAIEPDRVHDARSTIVAATLAALEIRIPAHEADLGRLQNPEQLSAWSAYHIGLQHMFRFNRRDNEIALGLFDRALAIDPNFARAHGGLSFAHFQNAFLQYGSERDREVARAIHCAEAALRLDALDPFANLNMGRAHWLEGRVDAGIAWLDRAIELNPNYAQAIYSRAWSEMILGDSEACQRDVDDAMSLSPIDPLGYAMSATRAMSHVLRLEFPLAAEWAEKAARAPGAHHLIGLIAVACHEMNGDAASAARWAEATRKRAQETSQEDFFLSFPFADPAVRAGLGEALRAHGF